MDDLTKKTKGLDTKSKTFSIELSKLFFGEEMAARLVKLEEMNRFFEEKLRGGMPFNDVINLTRTTYGLEYATTFKITLVIDLSPKAPEDGQEKKDDETIPINT